MEQQVKYSDTEINAYILKAVREMGFEYMTPIQEQAIPVLLDYEIYAWFKGSSGLWRTGYQQTDPGTQSGSTDYCRYTGTCHGSSAQTYD